MNFFGVGGAELVIIIIIMLVVAGPKRMIVWAYHIGQYVGKFRKMWSEVVDVVQKEMDDAGTGIKLPKELPTRQNINKYVNELAKPYTQDLEKAAQEIQNPLKETMDKTEETVKDATKEPVKKEPITKTTTNLLGKPKPKDASVKPTAEAKTESSFGAWGNQEQKASNQAEEKPATSNDFGAWTKPSRPDEQVEQGTNQ